MKVNEEQQLTDPVVCQISKASTGPESQEVCMCVFTVKFKQGKERKGHPEDGAQGKNVEWEIPVETANGWN